MISTKMFQLYKNRILKLKRLKNIPYLFLLFHTVKYIVLVGLSPDRYPHYSTNKSVHHCSTVVYRHIEPIHKETYS